MISYITEVTLCLLGFYLLYALWLSKETFFKANRWYLLGTLLTSLTIPLIEMPNFAATLSNGITTFYIEPITITVQSLETTLEEIVITPKEEGFDFRGLFVSIYLVVVVVLLFRFFFGLVQIYRLKRQGIVEKKGSYFLVKTNKSHLPFSFFNYLFWSEKLTFTEEEEEKILRHEITHIQEKHSYDVILLELLNVFLWCSPLIYFYKKALKNIHEYLADAAVLQNTQTRQYGQLLLKQSQSGIRIAQANNFIHSQLKKRIIMMTKNKSRQRSLLKYIAILPIALMLLLILSQKDVLANLKANDTLIENQSEINSNAPDEKILGDVDEMPRFSGCENIVNKEEQRVCSNKELIEFIYKNIKYPAEAKKGGHEGTVVIDFVVKEDGSLAEFNILKDVEGGCGVEALRVMKTMPKWIPGKKDGKPVSTTMTIPVKFALSGDDKASNTPKSDEETFNVVEQMPQFPGCTDLEDVGNSKSCSQKKLIEFIYKNIKYPEAAKKGGHEGIVVIEFVVKEDGSLADFKILKDVEGGCGVEALRVMKTMPVWIPGKHKGKAVSVNLKIPVKFKLDGKDKVINLPSTDSNFDDEVFMVVENMPVFPGCSDIEDGFEKKKCSNKNLFEFIFSNVKYPKEANEKGVEGKVIVKFIVDEEGNVIKPEIVKDPGEGLGDEVLRVINLMNEMPEKWTPGQQGGKNVNVALTLPVAFKAEKKEDTKPDYPKTEASKNQTLELSHFNAYPNPSNGNLNLELGEVNFPTTIKITDINGREIYSKKIDKINTGTVKINDIDISSAAKGNLFIVVEQDGKTTSKKILVQ